MLKFCDLETTAPWMTDEIASETTTKDLSPEHKMIYGMTK